MKKLFEIDYDESNSWQRHCAKQVIEWINVYKDKGLKVTEIKPPASMSVEKEYCECEKPKGPYCLHCFKLKKPKPPIEKLDAERRYDFSLSGLCQEVAKIASKQEEIIDWIENQKRG